MNIKTLLFMAAFFAVAPVNAAETLPVEWFGYLKYATIKDSSGIDVNPKTPDDFAKLLSKDFASDALIFAEDGQYKDIGSRPTIKNCLDVLAVEDAVFFYDEAFARIGNYCIEVNAISQMKPSNVSYWRDFKFTRKAIDELPVEIGRSVFKSWMPFSYEEIAIKDYKKVDFKNFGAIADAITKNWKGIIETNDYLGVNEPHNGVLTILKKKKNYTAEIGGVVFNIFARGDYDGDGVEDILMLIDGSYRNSSRSLSCLFVLSKKSKTGEVYVIKTLMVNGIPVDQIKRDIVRVYMEKLTKEIKNLP